MYRTIGVFVLLALAGCDLTVDQAPWDVDFVGCTDKETFFRDQDGDGWGDESQTVDACGAPPFYAVSTGDCDDDDPEIHPDGVELCDVDDVDEDCNGMADDQDPNAEGKVERWVDGDGDGYGDEQAAVEWFCDPLAGYADTQGDCEDANALVHPDATEIANDGIDQDCTGDDLREMTLFFEDFEGGQTDWLQMENGATFDSAIPRNGMFSLHISSGGVAVMNSVDASQCLSVEWEFFIKRGPEAPDPGEFLDLGFWSGTDWVDVLRIEGNSSVDPSFIRNWGVFSASASNPFFGISFVRNWGTINSDDVYIDDLTITCIY